MGLVGRRIGVLGGTFDPVHNGHLAIAETARAQCDLSEVVFVPAPRPWQKTDHALTPIDHRVAMLRLATNVRPYFRLSEVDINRPGPTYTIDTIADLRQELDQPAEFYFILGWDSLESLPSWKEASQLVHICYLVAAPRPHYPRPDLARLETAIPGISARLIFMRGPRVNVSASEIRERVLRGEPIHGMVPVPVERYIIENRLYGK